MMYKLPLFPLNTVLFPGTPTHLHIFEERYRLMMKRVLNSDRLFGVVLIKDGLEANGPIARTYSIGCVAKIIHVDPYPDGRMDIVAVGQERFRIKNLSNDLPYLIGTVEELQTEHPRTLDVIKGANFLRQFVRTYLQQIAEAFNRSSREDDLTGVLNQMDMPEDPTMFVYTACSLLQIPLSEKQFLLEQLAMPRILSDAFRLYRRELAIISNTVVVSEEKSRQLSWLN